MPEILPHMKRSCYYPTASLTVILVTPLALVRHYFVGSILISAWL